MASSASMNGSATPHTADHGDGGEHSSSTAPAAAATAGTRKGSGSATGEGGQQQVDMGAAADAVAALLKVRFKPVHQPASQCALTLTLTHRH